MSSDPTQGPDPNRPPKEEAPGADAAAERRELLRRLLESRAAAAPAAPTLEALPLTPREYPLSVGQQALYFLHRMAPESSSYNVVFAARIRSALDTEALDACWRRIVARHPSLRTTFERGQGGPVQRVGESGPVLERFEAAAAAHEDEGSWLEELRAFAGRPFDLARGPVARLGLFRRGAEDHALVLSAHHIAVDFWSFGVMLEELHRLYPAAVGGQVLELTPPAATYADVVERQRQLLAGSEGEVLERYWLRRLEHPPTLRLATDRPRGATQGFAGATHRFDLGPELAAGLRKLGRERGTTLFATLLAGLQALLHRYTGQRDVVVGSPVAGRSRRELEGVVGYFANMVALRGRPAPKTPFGELVDEARGATLEALEHGEYPFPLLVERLGLDRDPSRSPIFDVAFAVESSKMDRHGISGLLLGDPEATSELAGWSLESLPLSQQEGQFDLTFHLLETERSVGGLLMYDTWLFEESTARRMAGHLATLLAGAVEQPEAPLGELPLLPAAERRQLLEEWNATRAAWPDPMTVRDLFVAEARRRPDELALDDGTEALSFGELHRRAARLAGELRRLGADGETPVAVCGPRTTAPVMGFVAAILAGVPYLPLDPAYPDERLRFMIEDSGARLLVTTTAMAPRFAGIEVRCVTVEAAIEAGPVPAEIEPPLHAESLAYVIYTSGSTGRPKGVAIPHKGLLNLVLWHHQAFGASSRDRAANTAGPAFDATAWEVWAHLTAGASVHIASDEDRSSGSRFYRWLAQRGITLTFTPTPLAEAMLVRRPPPGVALRLLLTGGAQIHRFPDASLPFPVINAYGPTESSVVTHSSRLPPDMQGRRPAIGAPIANTRSHILDAALQLLPTGAAGELCIGGQGLARGYVGRPALTAERFVPDPFGGSGERLYRTGDLARYRADGEIECLGRIDQQVQIRGFRVELGEIEAALAVLPGIAEVAVCAVPSAGIDAGGERLVAYAVPRDAATPSLEGVREALQGQLPEYMVPSQLVLLDALPINPNGKIDREALVRATPAPGAPAIGPAKLAAAASGSSTGARRRLRDEIARVWAEVLGLETVDPDTSFFDLGGHSLLVGEVVDRLEITLGRPLKAVEIFQFPTVRALAEHLAPARDEDLAAAPAVPSVPGAGEPIAIIGLAGRFPGAASLDDFWDNLCAGEEAVSFFSEEELAAAGVPGEERRRPDYVAAAAVLEGIEDFDASFFGFSPREAEILDPQQRFFLECAWHCLEDGGYDPGKTRGRVGVFAGLTQSTYWSRHLATHPELVAAVGDYQLTLANDKDFLPTRVSYKLDLQGPSINVQTACSTSLVAVHLACQSLRQGECEMAMAGGATIRLPHRAGYRYQAGMILSPDGHCRPFDADAHGTVGGNGVGVVLLKPLSRALADGDPVRAVIRGSALNNDGSGKVGYTAPSVDGQTGVLRAALAAAAVDPATIGYLEAHGTGTELGDPIEVQALNQAYAGARPEGGIPMGSLKSNLGHLDAAAGVAGLIKTTLALERGAIPPSLHFKRPNPKVDFAGGPFFVNAELRPWPRGDRPRRAAVSSFGIGGTNAHAILEEAPASALPASTAATAGPHLLVLSARSETALDEATANLRRHLERRPDLDLASVAFTLQAGRRAFGHRRALVVADTADAVAALGEPSRQLTRRASDRPVAFLFPGQGAQYPGMGRQLYDAGGVFRRELDRCADLAEQTLGEDLRDLLFPQEGAEKQAGERLRQTAFAQPALFAVEYALACQWIDWGVEPEALLGHSVGMYAAACLAGVLDLEAAVSLVVLRGRLIQALPPGAMLSVSLDADELEPRIPEGLSLAAINAPRLCVVSGPEEVVEAFADELVRDEVEHQWLHTSHAFHSAMMDPALEEFRRAVEAVPLAAPQRRLASDLTGGWLSAEEAVDPGYWTEHLRRTVRFQPALETLCQEGDPLLLEVGPGKTLSTFARRARPEAVAVPSMRHPRQKEDDREVLLGSLARLWLAGAAVDWSRVHGDTPPPRVSLPGYPFDRQRYWIEPAAPSRVLTVAPAPGPAPWRAVAAPPEQGVDSGETWLVLMDDHGLGDALVRRWSSGSSEGGGGPRLIRVWAGSELRRLDADAYTVDPRRREDFTGLLGLLGEHPPRRLVHLWNAGPGVRELFPGDRWRAAHELGEGVLEHVTAAAEALWPTLPLSVDVVTSGGWTVAREDAEEGAEEGAGEGAEPSSPEHRELVARCRELLGRLPFAASRVVDLEPWTGEEGPVPSAVEELRRELGHAPGEGELFEVALRSGERWERRSEVGATGIGAPGVGARGTEALGEGLVGEAGEGAEATANSTLGGTLGATVTHHRRPPLDTAFVEPETPTQKSIAGVWEELLGLAPVGLHDDFFELGGHSLLGTRVLARLQDLFDREIPLSELFERPTVARLADVLKEPARDRGERPDVPALVASKEEDEVETGNLSDADVEAMLRGMLAQGDEVAE